MGASRGTRSESSLQRVSGCLRWQYALPFGPEGQPRGYIHALYPPGSAPECAVRHLRAAVHPAEPAHAAALHMQGTPCCWAGHCCSAHCSPATIQVQAESVVESVQQFMHTIRSSTPSMSVKRRSGRSKVPRLHWPSVWALVGCRGVITAAGHLLQGGCDYWSPYY